MSKDWGLARLGPTFVPNQLRRESRSAAGPRARRPRDSRQDAGATRAGRHRSPRPHAIIHIRSIPLFVEASQ